MVEIEFSYIHDFDQDERIWQALLEEFGAQNGIKVHLRRMNWDTAWAELFSFTSINHGPQVSHVGNTWVSSLARMNTLRPFKPAEIAEIGAAKDFMAPNWETGILPGDKRTWAIPWTAWIHVVCYRKDLLKKAGIDPSGAFGTIKAGKNSVERLMASELEIPWLNTQLYESNRDLLHIAASWIWAAGGDFMDKDGTKALFNSPQAIGALVDWLEMYRVVSPVYKKLNQQEIFDLFSEGRAAAVLGNIQAANTFMNLQNNPAVQNHLGVASVTEVPWTGGGSFVIWDDLHGSPEQERASVNLVKFLSTKEVQLRYSHKTGSMPSRLDALQELYPQGNPAREAVMLAAKKGRGFFNMPIWRRVEQKLSEELGAAVADAAADMSADPAGILHKHLDGLVARMNNTLGG